MALKTPYCTVVEANAYLKSNEAWSNLDNSEKNTHLLNGRYYIDSNYTCSEIDEANIPDEFKYANALLAEFDLSVGIFSVSATGNAPVVKEKAKAGEVESEITYAGSRSTSLRLNGIDQFPSVTSILNEYCSLEKGSGIKSVSLLRA